MAYKQKAQSIHAGTSSHKSALKMAAASPNKAATPAYGGTKTWEEGMTASGGTLNDLVAKRKGLKKGSAEYNEVQNKINKALGSKKVHSGGTPSSKPYAPHTPKVDVEKKGGKVTATETSARGEKDSTTVDSKGRVRKTVDQTNRSTYNPDTQTGSSGLGMQTTTKKFKKSGEAKRKTKTSYSMGTDTKKDDKRVTTTIGKRKQKSRERDSDGTITKTKHYTKGKKAGTSKTRVRQKGKLFGKKVDVDYS